MGFVGGFVVVTGWLAFIGCAVICAIKYFWEWCDERF